MDFSGQILAVSLLSVLALLLSIAVPVMAHRRWKRKGMVVGCLLQPVVFLVLVSLLMLGCIAIEDALHHSGTMVCVRNIEEDRNCRFEQTWHVKANGTCYYEFDKGSHPNREEPCGNDYYGREQPVERLDTATALKTDFNLVVYFDLEHRKVTPVYDNDTIEVVKVDWDRVESCFRE